jgi:hypothetical protein
VPSVRRTTRAFADRRSTTRISRRHRHRQASNVARSANSAPRVGAGEHQRILVGMHDARAGLGCALLTPYVLGRDRTHLMDDML